MANAQTDSLGRATFHYIRPDCTVRPNDRDRRWFRHIARHGPQSSVYLYELTRDTHRCRDTALRRLQEMRAGGFLDLPRQQRATERAECQPYIYDLTRKAKDHLADLGLGEPTVRPTGHWWHAYLTACVTSSIDICAASAGIRYIPAHEILAIKGSTLAIPYGKSKLIPDQLFALDYCGSFRAFALEVDQGTEPKTSPANRKSWARSIAQYDDVVAHGIHQTHYGLTCNLLVLWGFITTQQKNAFLNLARKRSGSADRSILTQAVSENHSGAHSAHLLSGLFMAAWERPDQARIRIDQQ
jgi:hypothetical protein